MSETTQQEDALVPVPDEVVAFFRRHQRLVVVGHLEPDADCIGSQVALADGLTRSGVPTQLLSPGPFERQEIAVYADRFVTDPGGVDPDATGVVVVDCSSADRIHPFEESLNGREMLVVDHHREGRPFGNVHFIRPDVPANTILITAILDSLAGGPRQQEAQDLFLGLVTDTGFFRFLGADEPVAFETAARLTRAGASPRLAAEHLDSGRSWGSRKIIARMLDRVEQLQDGQVLLTYMTSQDELEFGTRRDTDALYRLLLAIEDVRVIGVVKEKAHGCTVSFRANDETDVSRIAADFGGGGHQKAAGAFSTESLTAFLPHVRTRLATL